MSNFRRAISNTGELGLVELMTTNENSQWKKLKSVKFDTRKAYGREQYSIILKVSASLWM